MIDRLFLHRRLERDSAHADERIRQRSSTRGECLDLARVVAFSEIRDRLRVGRAGGGEDVRQFVEVAVVTWRRHCHQEPRDGVRTVCEGVGNVRRHEDGCAGSCGERLALDAELELAVQEIPGFLESFVDVQPGVEAGQRLPLGQTRAGGAFAFAARRLRESVYRLVQAVIRGEQLPAPELHVLNEWAGRPALAPQIGPNLERQWTGGVESALTVLAREAVELLATSDRKLIRECAAAPECSRIYLDRSAGRRRRWCHMEWCGSNAKMRAYRRRRAAAL